MFRDSPLYLSTVQQWGTVSGTPNDLNTWDTTKGYEVRVVATLPINFKNSGLFAVANVLGDAGNVVDEKAECSGLSKSSMNVKIASSRQGNPLEVCYFILGY